MADVKTKVDITGNRRECL